MELNTPRWRTSSRSNGVSNCVEVADNVSGRILVRDTKDRDGGTLNFGPGAWSHFVEFVKG